MHGDEETEMTGAGACIGLCKVESRPWGPLGRTDCVGFHFSEKDNVEGRRRYISCIRNCASTL
jgi:hypothetical protein